jgi:hypothetical protein
MIMAEHMPNVSESEPGLQGSLTQTELIDEFKAQLLKYRVRATCGRFFYRVKSLLDWFKHEDRVEKLIYAAFRQSSHGIAHIDDFSKRNTLLLLFSMLLDTGNGRLVRYLQGISNSKDLADITSTEIENQLQESDLSENSSAREFLKKFDQRKLEYCPISLESGSAYKSYPKERILPIIRRQDIRKLEAGSRGRKRERIDSSALWAIDVVAEFVDERMARHAVPQKSMERQSGHEVAGKTVTHENDGNAVQVYYHLSEKDCIWIADCVLDSATNLF